MALQEDCASVLDQFIHDVANLPAEVNHYMEEIQAIEKDLSKVQAQINAKDSALQKHVKAHGSLVPHPKETEFSQVILRLHDQCQELQDRKIGLAEKTSIMLERHIKKFDVKIRELQNGEHLPKDLVIPSLFNRKQAYPDSGRNIFSQVPSIDTNQPLQTVSGNTVHNLPARAPSQQQIQQSRISQLNATRPTEHRSSAPATPAPNSQLLHPHSQAAQQRQRESSVGSAIDPKRRRLNPSHSASNLPVQSSSLRQPSHGPGTPKATTPSRSGSVPRSTPAASGAGPATKKATGTAANVKKVAPHQQVSKLKGKPNKRSSLTPNPPSSKKTGAGRATSKGASPAAALRGGGRGTSTGAESDTGSVLSTASSSSLHKPKREPRDENEENVNNDADHAAGSGSEDGGGEGEEEEDKGLYCICNQVSYGDMVGCDNDDCPYQWFHLKCVSITKSPREDELWFCAECCSKGLGPPDGEGKPLGKGMVMLKKSDGK